MAGSRPGALSAGCWAAMIHLGYSGYVESTKKILTAACIIKKGYIIFYAVNFVLESKTLTD